METKFMLHGGMLKYKTEHNDSFFREFTKDLQDGDKVLWIGFAREDEDERQRIYERDKGLILAATDKKIEIEKAELDTLIKQVREAKAVFTTGGVTEALIREIAKYPDFTDALKGKVYAGSSAGAYLFSTHYFACQDDVIREGLGVLPIRIMAHYRNLEFNATDEALERLKEYPNGLELIVLKDCEWTVREIDL